MATDYRLDIFNTSGQKVAEFSDRGQDSFLALAYTKRLKEPGLGRVVFRGLNPDLSKWVDKGLVEIWRRNTTVGLDWYCDFRGIYLAKRLEYTGRDIATLTFPGDKWLLGTRVVAWYANTANRSKFTSAKPETIAKTLVAYNAGSSATVANGRLKEGGIGRVLTGATIATAADSARGTNTDWSCMGDNLLTTLQKLALASGSDWDLNYTGTLAWTFEYYPTLGTDLSSTLVFSLERNNAGDPVYIYDRTNEVTSLLVGGKGIDTARRIVEVHGPNWSTSNDIEGFLSDSGNENDTDAALTASGTRKLQDLRALETFSQTPIQTPTSFYGSAYCVGGVLGDKVSAKFRDITATQRIVGVQVGVDQEGEQVKVEAQTI